MEITGVTKNKQGDVVAVEIGLYDHIAGMYRYVDLYSEPAIREIVRQEIAHAEQVRTRSDEESAGER